MWVNSTYHLAHCPGVNIKLPRNLRIRKAISVHAEHRVDPLSGHVRPGAMRIACSSSMGVVVVKSLLPTSREANFQTRGTRVSIRSMYTRLSWAGPTARVDVEQVRCRRDRGTFGRGQFVQAVIRGDELDVNGVDADTPHPLVDRSPIALLRREAVLMKAFREVEPGDADVPSDPVWAT